METVEQLVSFHHIQVQLSGGAPWGFTLKGGLEHGEPLIITKIEDGGKAAHCKKLKVGDELININGSALYGSRQEALILIKGSYRILKLTVRRRNVPLIRPHSWHLAKVSELPLPPPPPSPPPCLPSADSPPLPPPPPPSAMQLHPGPYTLPWHSTDNSDLSMQWGQLSRPYSSTDRSSSLGSMESLDTPTPAAQPYSDSHNSPVDPALFNNKRDSAYSSFSASSNTSDYAAVPLRPGETCSMDNLLQSLGPACRNYPGGDASSGGAPDDAQLIVQKSRSLTRPRPKPVEVKERPSSCCYEVERRGEKFEMVKNGGGGAEERRKSNPPQPPTRKDSFRATQSRHNEANKRCASAPIEISSVSSYYEETKTPLNVESGIHNGFSEPEECNTENFQDETLDSQYKQRQTEDFGQIRRDANANKDYILDTTSDQLGDQATAPLVPINSSHLDSLLTDFPMETQEPSHSKHSSSRGLHRHSAPEKLLATQLQLLQFNSSSLDSQTPSDPSDAFLPNSSHQPAGEDQEASQNHLHALSNKREGSRCSTPGSVFVEEDAEDVNSNDRLGGTGVNGGSVSTVQLHHTWGRSVSVPEEPSGPSSQGKILENDFGPLSSAVSVDTLLEDRRGVDRGSGVSGRRKEEDGQGEAVTKKSHSSRNHMRHRRRSERFATNLRNEIQRKKAEFQRKGLLCSGETVQEEVGQDLLEDQTDVPAQKRITKVAFASPVASLPADTNQDVSAAAAAQKSNASSESVQDASLIQPPPSTTYTQSNSMSTAVQILDPGVPSFGVGIRVVEEPAPAGKARRWRFTREHKLQPKHVRQCEVLGERVLGVTGSRHGVCAFTSSSSHTRSSSCSRMEEPDILPFADRMKFFEETSKGVSGSNVSTSSSRRTKKPAEDQEAPVNVYLTQRRYSYQGGLQQESSLLPSSEEARRQSAHTSRERQKEKEREARAREREWEERLRERERQQKEIEVERARLREMQLEREREDRARQWERERERELELEREKEAERSREKELERQRHRGREEDVHPEFHCNHQEFRQKDDVHNVQLQSHFYQSQAPRSAFHPVCSNAQPPQIQQPLQHGHTARSYTPTETYPAQRQEMSRLNRKYSLTERDCPSWRRESRPPQSIGQHHQSQWGPREADSGSSDRNGYSFAAPSAQLALRGRAMSENDLRFDGSRWSPSVSIATSQTLSELEEGAGGVGEGDIARQNRKKTPPPPRPPPPKWEQFHRRRASHHTLFSSSSSAAPHSIPPSFSAAEGHHAAHSLSYLPPPEESRQRSYSLPPERQGATEGCPRCSCNQTQTQTQDPPFAHASSSQNPALSQERPFTVAPPSPMFSRRAFRPVAPPQREREGNLRGSCGGQREQVEVISPLPPPPTDTTASSHIPDQDRTSARAPKQQHAVRPGAEWETSPPPRVQDATPPPPEASYFALDYEQQQKIPEPGTESEATLSPSPAHSLDADLDVPMETDIDDFQAEELRGDVEPFTSELPCFALPVTVLETDIDQEASPSGRTRAESSSPEEEPETGESRRERLSLEELFPQCSEGESGTESWRGASQTTEHSTDSLDRRSGASSSCSSYYSTSAAKAQLLSQLKDFSDNRDRDEDDELTYKRQLMESLRKKLGVLREAQRGLQDDIRANAQLGEEVESMVVSVCKPNEVDKFRMFIGDLDKVVSLMLSLSGRLLRVETTLDTLDPETEQHDRLSLLEKKRQLMRQLSEAQDLKDHVDRREQVVSRVLAHCLSPDQHRDYSHFVKMKAALLVEQRQLEDKIRLGEEQLRGLRESLGLGLGMGMGMSLGYGHY